MGGGKNFLVSAAGFSILGNGIFWWKAKTKRLFSQCSHLDCGYSAAAVAVAASAVAETLLLSFQAFLSPPRLFKLLPKVTSFIIVIWKVYDCPRS
jgi:hypothetical protein